ncbi:MAG: hypothetical protein JO339_30705 [Alphaproteobacteria bacterium]|nr:hypothetical protein [Alphaproteobacteria bacterium]
MNRNTTVGGQGQGNDQRRARRFLDARYIAVAACLLVGPGLANVGNGWELEEIARQPSFAAAIPSRTNLDIEAVVLACERGDGEGVLQLQLHPTGSGPASRSIGPPVWSYGRRAKIEIDERLFPADVLFADDYAVVANETSGRFPTLSDPLLDAMATGRTLILRLSVEVETISRDRAVDGYAKVDLQAGYGRRAIAELRRCANDRSR